MQQPAKFVATFITNLSLELGCSVAVRYSHTMLGFWPAKFASNHACGLTYEVDWFMSPNAALYVTVRALQLLAESWYYNMVPNCTKTVVID